METPIELRHSDAVETCTELVYVLKETAMRGHCRTAVDCRESWYMGREE